MLSTARPSSKLAHLSLFFVGLMWVFPFLDYYHAYPLTTFYQEWSAAVLGLAAMPLLAAARTWQAARVPGVVLLPLGLIVLVIVQFALGKLPYLGQMLLYALYLIWAALLVALGARLRQELGLAAVATALSVFLVVGAELSAAIGFIQHFGWHGFFDRFVTTKISEAVYGNVAQANHFADYLTLGLVSLGLLLARGTLRAWQVALLALPILFVLPFTGSREIWFYLVAMAALAWLWLRQAKAATPVLAYCLAVLLGFGLMHFASQVSWLAGSSGSVNSVQRMFAADVNSGSIRLTLWHEASLVFTQFPVLGAGFGEFAWEHFQLAPLVRDPHISGLYNNAHNLILQLAAEGGLVGIFILAATLLLWAMRMAMLMWRAEGSIYHWWGFTALTILAIHSLGEYPLWYAYFLGIAAILLGLLDEGGFRLERRRAGRAFVMATLLLGMLLLQQLLSGYRIYERLDALRPEPGEEAAYFDEMRRSVAELRGYALLQPYAERYIAAAIEVGPERVADKLARNADALRFIPGSAEGYRQALLLAQAGDLSAARTAMERAVWSYSSEFPETDLRRLARRDPGRFGALLEFALQKQEEYQRELHAVPGK